MLRLPLLLCTLLISVLLLIACETSSPQPAAVTTVAEEAGLDTTGQNAESPSAETGETILEEATVVLNIVEREEYGQYLTDGEGYPLYLFMMDENAGGSSCVNECVGVWPPLVAEEPLPIEVGEEQAEETIVVAEGVDETLVGTVEREQDDNLQQVTYNGWPLYRYRPDLDAEIPQGHGVDDYGDVWYLVTPQGTPLDNEAVEME